jgi:outer membrane protein assembly factor BamB
MQVSRRGLFVSSAAVLAGTALGGCAARSAGPAKDSASSAGAGPDPVAVHGPLTAPPLAHSSGSIHSDTAPRVAWTYEQDDAIRAVRYLDGQVYLCTIDSLIALDSANGAEVWKLPMFGVEPPQPEAVAGGKLYLGQGFAPDSAIKDAGILTIDCATGKAEMAYALPPGGQIGAVSAPLNGLVYGIATTDGPDPEVWAVDLAAGTVRWKAPASRFSNNYIHLAANGKYVVNGIDGRGPVEVFDAVHGTLAWSTESTDACRFNDRAPIRDQIIGYDNDAVFGLDLATGTKVWQATAPIKAGQPRVTASGAAHMSGPIIYADGSDAYYVWNGATVTAYKAGAAAEVLWSAAFSPGGFLHEVTIAFDGNDTMFLGGQGVFAADTRTGGCRWEYAHTEGWFEVDSAAGIGNYYVATEGRLVALSVA